MPSPFTVTVKVKPHIRKYLIWLSDNKAEPIIFKKNNHIYNRLLELLISRRKFMQSLALDNTVFDDDTTTIDIRLRWTRQDYGKPNIRWKHYISRRNQQVFNFEVGVWFNRCASMYILNQVLKGYTRWNAVFMLMNEMAITEDEIKAESLYRHFSRLQNEMCLT